MLTEEVLQIIENCGMRQFSEEETCIIAEISEDEYETCPAARRRYRRGMLKAQFEVRETVRKMAKEGVPQMVKIFQSYSDRIYVPPVADDGGEDTAE
ncbi:hypothetical protein [Victivallis vadensis]|uniref:hypothetical protein n=1 Tax=Victivallis vadensis TaxID=172901 RepID=UPI0023F7AC94|nr:hypothetical protein [Victivallis vadensis]